MREWRGVGYRVAQHRWGVCRQGVYECAEVAGQVVPVY